MMTASKGQYRVGIDFNPSGNDAVTRLKEKAAAFIDECNAQLEPLYESQMGSTDTDLERCELYSRAMREAEGAAMWAVKAATKRART